jgi:hypothetical protein
MSQRPGIRSPGILLGVAIIALAVALSGCSGVPFALIDEGYKVKPGSIAVISGVNDPSTNRLAETISGVLAKKSAFRVMSQEEIVRRVPNYPATIIEETFATEGDDGTDWLSPRNKGRVSGLHDRLKTDYVFVVWSQGVDKTVVRQQGDNCFTYTGYSVDVQGRLVEYPKNAVVGYSMYHGRKTKSCCLLFRSEGKDIDIMTADSAEEIAEKIIETTGTAKRK